MKRLICLVILFHFSIINSFASTSSNIYNTNKPIYVPLIVAKFDDFINTIKKEVIDFLDSTIKRVMGEPNLTTPKKYTSHNSTIYSNYISYLLLGIHKIKILIDVLKTHVSSIKYNNELEMVCHIVNLDKNSSKAIKTFLLKEEVIFVNIDTKKTACLSMLIKNIN